MTSARHRGTCQEAVVLADNLAVLRNLPEGCIDLVYIDPPFGTGQVRRLESIRTSLRGGGGAGAGGTGGSAGGTGGSAGEATEAGTAVGTSVGPAAGTKSRWGFGGREYLFDVVSTQQYRDDMPLEDYLAFLHERLVEIHRVLRPTGSLYLHLDFHAVHYARLLLDEVFGPERFLNEIIWAYDYGGRHKDRWPRKHDNILWYSKSLTWTFNAGDIERLPYMAPGLVGPKKAARGKLPTDTWWMTIVPTSSAERTGYPTQKPLKLLERIITASSNPGDLVADFFCGSGTTGVAAKRLGRRYLLVDDNPEAVRIANERLGTF